MSNDQSYDRYQRQLILKGFGKTGQQKLRNAKILVIGAGGLGCPVLQYLTAAGVGTIGIADADVVSLSNLHRQLLFTTGDIGQPKVLIAKTVLNKQNPDINIIIYQERISTTNALCIIPNYDIVIDGTDNFASRYLINDACVLLNKPLVYGAVAQFEGQVAIFNHTGENELVSTNYRDLFPTPPKNDEVMNCEEGGVLGVLPGMIGTMMASETIKLLTGIGQTLTNDLLTWNALTNQSFTFKISANPKSRLLLPADAEAFKKTDYEWLCAAPVRPNEISVDVFNELLQNGDTTVIDVREPGEMPMVNGFPHLAIPLGQLSEHVSSLQDNTIVVYCQSGVRSAQAVALLSGIFAEQKKIYSLRGGILAWFNAASQNN